MIPHGQIWQNDKPVDSLPTEIGAVIQISAADLELRKQADRYFMEISTGANGVLTMQLAFPRGLSELRHGY